MKKSIPFLAIPYLIYVFVVYYIMLPALNWHAPEFWEFLVITVGPILILCIVYAFSSKTKVQLFKGWQRFSKNPNVYDQGVYTTKQKKWSKICKGCILLLVIMIVFPSVTGFVTSRVFHAKAYAQRIKVQDVSFTEIPEVDFTKTPIIVFV